jgi:proteasome accessory factor BC
VGYASKAEHDFSRPDDFDPRIYATRTDWQLGDPVGRARIWLSERIDWLALRHFGHAGEVTDADDGVQFETDYADSRQLISWVLGLGPRARILDPPELAEEAEERLRLVMERHASPPELAPKSRRKPRAAESDEEPEDTHESPIRPERFARLVTLAGILIEAARDARKLVVSELCETLQVTELELRQDIDVLNVVNFGGGSYVLYAEVQGDTVEVDPEPYGDNFARPARLLPLEAKALVAAIDLIGEHLPEGSLASARQKITGALGQDPAEEGLQITTAKGDDSEVARVVSSAITRQRLLQIEYYKENEDLFTERTVEPYKLMNGQEGWYVHVYDLEKDAPRSYRLDRIRTATVQDESFEPREGIEPDVHGWPSTGEVPDSRLARVWISPERARWAREERRVAQELRDGSVIVEFPYAGHDYLAREILKEAGDAVVLEPDEAREAVLEAAGEPAGAAKA